jgi:hypothetical protein
MSKIRPGCGLISETAFVGCFYDCKQRDVAVFMHRPSEFVRFALLNFDGLSTDDAAWKPTFVEHGSLQGGTV